MSSKAVSLDTGSARPPGRDFQWRRGLVLVGGVIWLSLFLSLGVRLVANRHFQVDEFQESFNSFLLAEPSLREFTVHPQPFMVPLGYLAHQLDGTPEILLVFRFIFLLVLLINLILCVLAQPFFPRPYQKLVCLVALSGFVTFWRHGLEVRHDNLAITGCLLLYWLTVLSLVGERRWQPLRELASGGAFLWLLISAHKGFVLAIPLLVLFFYASWQRYHSIGRTLMRSMAGVLALAVPLAGILAATGTLASILRGVQSFFHHLGDVQSFSQWPRILQIASAYPHVACLAVMALCSAVWRARRRPWRLTVSTMTACYVLGILAFLEINPKPYHYNFLYLVPFVFISALDGARRLGRALRGPGARAAAAAAMVGATVLGGVGFRQRDAYFNLRNEFQLSYIAAAESLTDPREDPVLDGIGMVLTRRPALKDWQLHGSFMPAYTQGRRQSFADLIRSDPPPVVFTSYRWTGLEAEWKLLEDRYVQVAKDFWLLGENLVEGSGDLEIHRAGRYRLVTDFGGEIRLDGAPLRIPAATHLREGTHRVEAPVAQPIFVHWIGPADDLQFRPLPPRMRLVQGFL